MARPPRPSMADGKMQGAEVPLGRRGHSRWTRRDGTRFRVPSRLVHVTSQSKQSSSEFIVRRTYTSTPHIWTKARTPEREREVGKWLQQPFGFAAGDERDDLFDDLLDGDPLGLGVEVGNDAVAEDGRRRPLRHLRSSRAAGRASGAGLARHDHVLPGARASAPA